MKFPTNLKQEDHMHPDWNNDKLLQKLQEHRDKALRYNEGKLKWSLVHFESLTPLVRVMMYGAKKYAPDNWKNGMSKRDILDSLMRHVAALADGQEIDPESEELHIGHIMANAMFWQFYHLRGEQEG